MVILFRTKKLKEPSLRQKLLRIKPKENGFIRINNLMAQQRSLENLPKEEIYSIVEQYDIQLRTGTDKLKVSKMYAQLLRGAFVQQQLNDVRINELLYFKQLFALSDRDVFYVHRSVVKILFKQDLEQILGGRTAVPQAEVQFLRKLQAKLMLPEALASPMYKQKPASFLQHVLQDKRGDATLSRAQSSELKVICESLGILLPKHPTLEQLYKCRLYWCVENGRVPRLPSPTDGNYKGERCYLVMPMNWMERIKRLRYTHYGEVSLRVKIMRGTYWKTPLAPSKKLEKEVWQLEDKGDICLTSKRLFFAGENGNRQVPLAKIANFLVYKNGIDIQRVNGEGTFFELQAHADIFAMLLGKSLSEL